MPFALMGYVFKGRFDEPISSPLKPRVLSLEHKVACDPGCHWGSLCLKPAKKPHGQLVVTKVAVKVTGCPTTYWALTLCLSTQ